MGQPEPSGKPVIDDATRRFIEANPYVLGQASDIWHLMMTELITELRRVDNEADEQGIPSPVNKAFLNWLDREAHYSQTFENLMRLAMGGEARLLSYIQSPLGDRTLSDRAIADMSHLFVIMGDLARFLDLREGGEERIFYALTHPELFNEIRIAVMVGIVFGRLATKYGVRKVSNEAACRIADGIAAILAPPKKEAREDEAPQ